MVRARFSSPPARAETRGMRPGAMECRVGGPRSRHSSLITPARAGNDHCAAWTPGSRYANGSSGSGGAGAIGGGSAARPRCSRMRRRTGGSVRNASTRRRPPQCSHTSTSTSKTRRIRGAGVGLSPEAGLERSQGCLRIPSQEAGFSEQGGIPRVLGRLSHGQLQMVDGLLQH